MELRTRTDKIRQILRKLYPEAKTPLYHETPFQLLVATILSAQCTDKQVNRVTGVLFNHLKTPTEFAKAPLKTLEKYIHSTGFYHNKAKNIKNCSRQILGQCGVGGGFQYAGYGGGHPCRPDLPTAGIDDQ